MFTHLHVRSWFSFLAGGSSPEVLARRAAELGMVRLGLTDRHGVYGAVRFHRACEEHGITPVFGAEIVVEGGALVLLAENETGYANLCRLATVAHKKDRLEPEITLEELAKHRSDLFCLTGGTEGRLRELAAKRRLSEARAHIRQLHELFGERLSIEITHHLRPGDNGIMRCIASLADDTGVPLLATGDVRYAAPEDYRRYDLMTCIRHGITVFDPHPERPRNAEAHLKSEAALRKLIPYPEAFARAAEVAAACNVDLLPGHITPPPSRLAEDGSPDQCLKQLCYRGLHEKYPAERRRDAHRQLQKEFETIASLGLSDFFLVVHEIVSEARRRGIRCAGRGSAANSIVAYLLEVTGVDPLAHNLLFERFLHGGRVGTPDIDVDFDAERRDEVIAWIEERFGHEHTAMTATLITYRLRSALRDAAKALGWSVDTVDALSKAVPPRNASRVEDYREEIEEVLGKSRLTDTLIEMVEGLAGCPRHLGLHSGGMVLSHEPLCRFTPVQRSANGVTMVQFDKDDVEALGLVKFDVLGLRMLASLTEAEELARSYEGMREDLDRLPLDDIPTFNMIRAGKTLGLFQIESQGQLHLLAKHQPETFGDIITEIALFRPGPLQGGMVKPFVRRRQGREPVTYDHPSLKPILEDTYGVILFQEQVLQVAHEFAGMSLQEADEFRRLMSRFRDPGQMEDMRESFVESATARGIPHETANEVFDKISNFVGYGFCRSHAAAFAKTVYQSAYMKRHYPAAFMAAIMQHRPGMYNLMTLEEEARRFGVMTLPPDIHRSGVRYVLEPDEAGKMAIRKPLAAVEQLTAETAKAIVWERLQRPFESVEELFTRVAIERDAFEALARSGALDDLAGSPRRALWEVGLLFRRLGRPGQQPTPALFKMPAVTEDDIPRLPLLTEAERLSWDYQTHGAARRHPMTLLRRTLNELEVRPIETCYRLGRYGQVRKGSRPIVTVGGLSVLRQRPPTAKGVMFLTLEDETGFIQCVVYPTVLEEMGKVLKESALILRGALQIEGNWRGLVVQKAWRLDGIFGGYEGHPCHSGGRDRWVRQAQEAGAF